MFTKEFRPLATKIRSLDEKRRTIVFTSSTEKVDRAGDIIRASGWVLDNYRKNPIVLWAHRASDPPVGKCVEIHVESKSLVQTVEFAPKEVLPFADTVWNLYREGFLTAVSVGFLPLEEKPITDEAGRTTGYEFTKQELLELSCVPVPSQPDALARAVRKGIITDAQARSFSNSAPHVSDAELFERFSRDLDAEELDAESIKTMEELFAALRG